MQFGINKHKLIFQRLTKYGLMQFVVLEKFTSGYLFQIAQEKSCDYLLIIYMKILMTENQNKCNFGSAHAFI